MIPTPGRAGVPHRPHAREETAMLTHDRFRELFLDYLYDLLDEADAQAVREYVAAHPAARAELDRARTLLAGAARVAFPNVSFQAPAAEPAVTKPTASPRPAAAP